MKFSIGSQGFSTFDQELLLKQLHVANTRLDGKWYYQGEAESVTLVLEKSTNLNGSSIICRPGKFFKQTCSDADPIYHIKVDWPVRILPLLDVLQKVEKNCSCESSGQNPVAEKHYHVISEHLQRKAQHLSDHQSLLINCRSVSAVILRDGDKLVMHSDRPEEILAQTLVSDAHPEIVVVDEKFADTDPDKPYCATLQSLLWCLNLHEPLFLAEQQRLLSSAYQLRQWPDYSKLYRNERILQLTAAFVKRPTSINDVTRITRASKMEAMQFIKACENQGVNFTAQPVVHDAGKEYSAAKNSSKPEKKRQLSFLASLRNKLKVALS